VDALREVCGAAVPGGHVVDLQAIEPSGRVELDGRPLGRIDDTAFFRRARGAVAGLDVLVTEGLLLPGPEAEFDTLVRYDWGAELVAMIADANERDLPETLARRLADVGPCAIRERSYVRVLRRPVEAAPPVSS